MLLENWLATWTWFGLFAWRIKLIVSLPKLPPLLKFQFLSHIRGGGHHQNQSFTVLGLCNKWEIIEYLRQNGFNPLKKRPLKNASIGFLMHESCWILVLPPKLELKLMSRLNQLCWHNTPQWNQIWLLLSAILHRKNNQRSIRMIQGDIKKNIAVIKKSTTCNWTRGGKSLKAKFSHFDFRATKKWVFT